ncbi:helix-turn-helix domain-containing protein [Nocardia asteroides]|uniref:helix-turn-helix domain-containing protein n=1 Tax=Nocardia asteroides TaxID=1824 RepID=UPI0037C96B0F
MTTDPSATVDASDPCGQYFAAIGELRRRAGNPGRADIAVAAGISRSAVGTALVGPHLPTARIRDAVTAVLIARAGQEAQAGAGIGELHERAVRWARAHKGSPPRPQDGMSPSRLAFHRELAAVYADSGRSAKFIAARMHTGTGTVESWLSGRRLLKPAMLERLMAVLSLNRGRAQSLQELYGQARRAQVRNRVDSSRRRVLIEQLGPHRQAFRAELARHWIASGKSAGDIAAEVGASRSAVDKWFYGERLPKLATVETLATVLGLVPARAQELTGLYVAAKRELDTAAPASPRPPVAPPPTEDAVPHEFFAALAEFIAAAGAPSVQVLAYLSGEPAPVLAAAITGAALPSAGLVERIITELVDRVEDGSGPHLACRVQTLHRQALP